MLRADYEPFRWLAHDAELEAAVRLFELRPGESLTLQSAAAQQDFLYVLDGCVTLEQPGVTLRMLSPRETRPQPLALPRAPHSVTLRTDQAATICHADSAVLDHLLSWEGLIDILPATALARDRMRQLRRSSVFRRVPLECVEDAFERMTIRWVQRGEEVVTQGESGEEFYVIASGRAEVWQLGLYDDAPRMVAELREGDAFGDDALVTGGTRNATVRMVQEGQLLVLGKGDFQELLSRPLTTEVTAPLAKAMIDGGCAVLDVRFAEERENGFLPGSIHIPLPDLRAQLKDLGTRRPYVVYCRSGRRSAVATLLMRRNGLDATSLRGGILDWPFGVTSREEA